MFCPVLSQRDFAQFIFHLLIYSHVTFHPFLLCCHLISYCPFLSYLISSSVILFYYFSYHFSLGLPGSPYFVSSHLVFAFVIMFSNHTLSDLVWRLSFHLVVVFVILSLCLSILTKSYLVSSHLVFGLFFWFSFVILCLASYLISSLPFLFPLIFSLLYGPFVSFLPLLSYPVSTHLNQDFSVVSSILLYVLHFFHPFWLFTISCHHV